MLTTIKQNMDWGLAAVYGSVNSIFLMAQPGSSIDFWGVVARTVIVTVVAFLAKKFIEWAWEMIVSPWFPDKK